MFETPLQNVRAYCGQCKKLKEFAIKMKHGNYDMNDVGELRKKCARCKTPTAGIYKADAILGVVFPEIFRKPLKGKGRACTIPASIQQKIKERYDAGETQQAIADSIGCSRSQVQRIIKRLGKE